MNVLFKNILLTCFMGMLFASEDSFLVVGESRYVLTGDEVIDDARLICKHEAIINMTHNIVMLPPEAINLDCFSNNLFDLVLLEETINDNLLYVKYEAKIVNKLLFGECLNN